MRATSPLVQTAAFKTKTKKLDSDEHLHQKRLSWFCSQHLNLGEQSAAHRYIDRLSTGLLLKLTFLCLGFAAVGQHRPALSQQLNGNSIKVSGPQVPDLIVRQQFGHQQQNGGPTYSSIGADESFPPPPSPLVTHKADYRGWYPVGVKSHHCGTCS